MERVILIRYGEIHLKGKNRPFFVNKLRTLLKAACMLDPKAEVSVFESRYYVENYDVTNEAALIKRVSMVFGVHSVSPAYKTERTLDAMAEAGAKVMAENGHAEGTFKVEAKRADKRYTMNSMQVAAELGGRMLDSFETLKVDVHKPEHILYAEVRSNGSFVYTETIKGPGGMPVGSSGKAMLLLSGGIDSPVAAYMLAKRGLKVEAIHFHSPPYTSERAKQKVVDLAGILNAYCGPIRLHVVPFSEVQEAIYEQCPNEYLTIIMRRLMMQIAERIAGRRDCGALATGESLAQVASQTLLGLNSTNAAVDMLVLRPLLCMDKIEIMDIAQKIDTYETSIQPFEDCCTVFVSKHPATRPNLEKVMAAEKVLDVEGLLDRAIRGIEVIQTPTEG